MDKLFILKPAGKRKVKFNEFYIGLGGRLSLWESLHESDVEYQVLEPIPVEIPEYSTQLRYRFSDESTIQATGTIPLKYPPKKHVRRASINGQTVVAEPMTDDEFEKWSANAWALSGIKWQKVEE
jgi:hypothetical protein